MIVIALSLVFAAQVQVYPGAEWDTRTPQEVGLDSAKLDTFADYVGGRGCVVRHGYMVYTWGSQSYREDVASACKPWNTHFLFKAVEDGRLPSLDSKAVDYESCLNNINVSLGYKDRNITFRHMANQISCYGVSENPGTAFDYNDWQTALYFDTLFKEVYGATYTNLDSTILHPLLTDILQCQDNPTFMAFGAGDRPGRVGVSVRDFARFGLLYRHNGNWNGQQLISQQHAIMAVTTPLPNSIPRTTAIQAEMCPGQRSYGSTHIPDDQTDHLGSYSFNWWTNGVDRNGQRHWPDAPLDTYGALGHANGKRAVDVIPSLDIVVSWNDTTLGIKPGNPHSEALGLLVDAVVETCDPNASVTVDLGETDIENCLTRVEPADGNTISTNIGARNCRRTDDAATDKYMYFAVNDNYAYQGDKSDLYITIEYYDNGNDTIRIQYDSAADAYSNTEAITMYDSQTWKRYTYHITDAYLGNRQNMGADFRLYKSSSYLYLDVVEVFDQPPAVPAGSIVVDPDHPAWLKYKDGGPMFMCGPGDPEGFLYRGTRNPDGTRSGDQMTLINKMIGTGANCIYLMALRSHGGDGGPTENPFVDGNVDNSLDDDILNQWETWFTVMDDNGIIIYFFFYDDNASPFGKDLPTSGVLDSREANLIDAIVSRFKHHKHLIWCVAEEYQEGLSDAHAEKFAERIKLMDTNQHPVAIHQLQSTSFNFNGSSQFDQFAVQWNRDTVSELHSGTLSAWNDVGGQVNINMAEFANAGTGTTLRQKIWAIALAGGYSMIIGMDIASTPVDDLQACGRLVQFMRATRFNEASPSDNLAQGDTDYVLADAGNVYIAYGDSGTSLGIYVLSGKYQVKWYDPLDGDWVDEGIQTLWTGNTILSKPGIIGNEAVVYLDFVDHVTDMQADQDRDGDVDQEDFGKFQVCLSGSYIAYPAGCADADLDADGDVDQDDLELFHRCMSGENVPADPTCAE